MARTISISLLFGWLCLGCLPEVEVNKSAGKGQWTTFTKKDGLGENWVKEIYQDSTGIIWFGHVHNGLTRFDGEKFKNLTTADGLLSNNVTSFLYDSDGTLLIGTTYGLNAILKDDPTIVYYPALEGYPITSIVKDKRGIYWYGTIGYGILYEIAGEIYQYFDSTCGDCNNINDILEATDGNIWFATEAGIKRYDGKKVVTFNLKDFDLSDRNIFAMYEDDWGHMWFSSVSSKFIIRYTDEIFEKVDLMGSNYVTCFEYNGPGRVWLGTLGEGLVDYDGAIMHPIVTTPSNDGIAALMRERNGTLWIGNYENGAMRYTQE